MHGGGACQEMLAKGRLLWKLKQQLLLLSSANQWKLRMQLLMWLETGAKLLPVTAHAMYQQRCKVGRLLYQRPSQTPFNVMLPSKMHKTTMMT